MKLNTIIVTAVTGLSLLPGLAYGLPSSGTKSKGNKKNTPASSNPNLASSSSKAPQSRNPILKLFDPEQKIEACAAAEATSGDLMIALYGTTDDELKWQDSLEVKEDGSGMSDKHRIPQHRIDMIGDLTTELLSDLKKVDMKSFVEKIPEGFSDIKQLPESFNDELAKAKQKCADVRKEGLASVQRGLTILLRVCAKGSTVDLYNSRNGRLSILGRAKHVLEAYQNSPVWMKLQLTIRNIGTYIRGYDRMLEDVKIDLEQAESVLPLSQRGGIPLEITRNEEKWIKADGTWKWMGQYYAKAYKVKDEDGPEKLSRATELKLSRFIAGRAAEQLRITREELIKKKQALLDKLESQLDPNSAYMAQFHVYEAQIGEWNLKKDLMKERQGKSSQESFPDNNVLNIWMGSLVDCYIIIQTIMHERFDLVDEIKGLHAIYVGDNEQYIPQNLRDQAAAQLVEVRKVEKHRIEAMEYFQRQIGGLIRVSTEFVTKQLQKNANELIEMKKRLLGTQPAVAEVGKVKPGTTSVKLKDTTPESAQLDTTTGSTAATLDQTTTALDVTVTKQELGINPEPTTSWFNLRLYVENEHPQVTNSLPNQENIIKLRRHWKEKHTAWLKQLPLIYHDPQDTTSPNRVAPAIQEYLQDAEPRYGADGKEIVAFRVTIKKNILPLMQRVKVDFAVAQLFIDAIPHMIKEGDADLQQKLNELRLPQYIHAPEDGVDSKKEFKEILKVTHDKIIKDVAGDMKATTDAALDVFFTIDETLALREDVLHATQYVARLEEQFKQPKWLIELKMSSPTLSTPETTELIMRQLFALDYVSEMLENKINRAVDYTNTFFKIAHHLKIGDEKSRTEVNKLNTKLSDLKKGLEQYTANGAPLIATNLRSMLKDTSEYLNNAKTSIVTEPNGISYLKPEEKIEMWDDLLFRAETLICIKAVVQHFSIRNPRVKQSLTKNLRQELNYEIDQIIKPVEEVRRFLQKNHPKETSRVHSQFDYDKPIDQKVVIDRCRTWAKAWEGQEARWHFQFPQEARFDNVLEDMQPKSPGAKKDTSISPRDVEGTENIQAAG